MNNYYDIFGLDPSCSLEDIKKSFRKKAKELHPDLAGQKDYEGIERLRLLLTAYRVLSDPEKREDYNRRHRFFKNKPQFNYREFLREKSDDQGSQSKLIFFDLLHDNEEDALDLYDRLLMRPEFSLDLFLDREDFMDCAFILSEEYEKKGNFRKAFHLLTKIVDYEMKKPYFRHFFEEVIQRLRYLSCSKLPSVMERYELLQCYFQLADFNFSQKETAWYTKKIAELYLELNRKDLAEEYLKRGLELNVRLPGAEKLKHRIGSFG